MVGVHACGRCNDTYILPLNNYRTNLLTERDSDKYDAVTTGIGKTKAKKRAIRCSILSPSNPRYY